MEQVWAAIATFAFFGLTMVVVAGFGRWAKKKGVAGPLLGIADEIFHPAAVGPRIEVRIQAERKDGVPEAGDPPDPCFRPDVAVSPARVTAPRT